VSITPRPATDPFTTSAPTSSGVMKIPTRLDAEALHTAAATFPRAMAVKPIDDCTVDGSMHRNRMPR
jgi:hypothetical protein